LHGAAVVLDDFPELVQDRREDDVEVEALVDRPDAVLQPLGKPAGSLLLGVGPFPGYSGSPVDPVGFSEDVMGVAGSGEGAF